MFRMIFLLAVAAGISTADGMHSVWIGPVDPAGVRNLQEAGFDVETVLQDKARIYVSSDQEHLLELLGYFPRAVVNPVPLVPYPTLTAIYDSLDAIAARHPDICRLETVGTTEGGRPIRAVVVTDNPAQEDIEPEFRLIGAIHGDEKTGAMVALNYLRNLADYSSTSEMCSYVVQTAETWVIPVMNPDGYFNNSRYNGSGVDLNRNLSYMWASGGGGPSPFSEPETQALRDITMNNWPDLTGLENPFCSSLSLHGGEACFNYVWNYSSAPVQDTLLIVDMAADYAALCTVPGFWVTEGWAWYIINGDVNDWSYGEYGGIDHTVEVHQDKQAADWPGVASAHYMSILNLFKQSTYGFYGTVEDQVGNPLDALIQVTLQDGGDSQPLRFCRTDVTLGDYAKPVIPGNYDITASVDGCAPQTVTGVAIGSQQRVEVDFVFTTQGTGEGDPLPPSAGLTCFPNPFRGSCTLQCASGLEGVLTIYDICGRVVYEASVPAGTSAMTWDGSNAEGRRLPAGVFLARLSTGQAHAVATLVLQR